MKHNYFLKFLIVSLFCSLSVITIDAHDFAVKNSDGKYVYYDINTNGTTVSVTIRDYNGYACYKGVINIPSEVTYNNVTYAVTNISSNAFSASRYLKEVNIPESVKHIGYSASYIGSNS